MQWFGWIKDYDGGTLMECVLYSRLPYTELPAMVRQQREALDGKIRGSPTATWCTPGCRMPPATSSGSDWTSPASQVRGQGPRRLQGCCAHFEFCDVRVSCNQQLAAKAACR